MNPNLPMIVLTFVLHLLTFDVEVRAVHEPDDLAVADVRHLHGPTTGTGCDEVAASIAQRLRELAFVQDQAGVFRSVFERAHESYPNCPESEPIAYALARSAELGFARLPIAIDGRTLPTADQVVDVLAARHPHSARIATVRARRISTVASAEAALAIDSSYTPAVLALAAAKSATNDPEGALKLLDGIRNVKSTPGFHTLRARVLLADGNSRAAVREAKQDISGTWNDTLEPFLITAVRRDAEEALGRALLVTGKRAQGIGHLRSAAEMGSDGAKQALATHQE
jgi:hypothetical protein